MNGLDEMGPKEFINFDEAVDYALKLRRSGHLLCILELLPAHFTVALYHHLDGMPLLCGDHIRLILP